MRLIATATLVLHILPTVQTTPSNGRTKPGPLDQDTSGRKPNSNPVSCLQVLFLLPCTETDPTIVPKPLTDFGLLEQGRTARGSKHFPRPILTSSCPPPQAAATFTGPSSLDPPSPTILKAWVRHPTVRHAQNWLANDEWLTTTFVSGGTLMALRNRKGG